MPQASGLCFLRYRQFWYIGGQDSKAITLNDKGRVKKFEMNDRAQPEPENFSR
jgi:hypothetical protein